MTFGQYLEAQQYRDDSVGELARLLADVYSWLDTSVYQDWYDVVLFRLDDLANSAIDARSTESDAEMVAELHTVAMGNRKQALNKARAEWRLHLQGQKRGTNVR